MPDSDGWAVFKAGEVQVVAWFFFREDAVNWARSATQYAFGNPYEVRPYAMQPCDSVTITEPS